MPLLEEEEKFVGKSGEGGESSTKAGDEQQAEVGRQKLGLFGQTEEQPDEETSDDVHRKGAVREGGGKQVMSQFADEKTAAGADESADAGDEHCFVHDFVTLEW